LCFQALANTLKEESPPLPAGFLVLRADEATNSELFSWPDLLTKILESCVTPNY
jgi:hypothetical protein